MRSWRCNLTVILAWHVLLCAHAFRQTNIAGSAAQAKISREKSALAKTHGAANVDASMRRNHATQANPEVSPNSGSAHSRNANSAKHLASPVHKSSFAEIAHLVSSKTSSIGGGLQLLIVFLLGMGASFLCFWFFYPYLFANQSIPLAPCQPLNAPAPRGEEGAPARGFSGSSVASDASHASQKKLVKKKSTVTFSPSVTAEQEIRESKEESTNATIARFGLPKKNTKELTEKAIAAETGTTGAEVADDNKQAGATAPNAGEASPAGDGEAAETFVSFTLSSGSELRPYRQHCLTEGSEIATFCQGDAFGYAYTSQSVSDMPSSDEGEKGTSSTNTNGFRADKSHRPPKPPLTPPSASSVDSSKAG